MFFLTRTFFVLAIAGFVVAGLLLENLSQPITRKVHYGTHRAKRKVVLWLAGNLQQQTSNRLHSRILELKIMNAMHWNR